MSNKVLIDGDSLTLQELVNVARHGHEVGLAEEAIPKIRRARQFVEDALAHGAAIYGINTGFGKFSDVAISEDELEELQRNLIYSDAVGIGRPFDSEIVRAMMLLRVNAVVKGYSGITLETINVLIEMLNKKVHPIVPEKGSVGSSGDLCPLAHMVLVMMGEGEAEYNGRVIPGEQALREAGITPVVLKAKEGLGLINGTQAMLAVGALAVYDAEVVMKSADITAALTLEALEGITDAYDLRVSQKARPHKGMVEVSHNMLKLTEGSRLTTHQGEKRIQDAYTLRCIPQVHGASRLALDYVRSVVETELNSATDNPLIFVEDDPAESKVISAGNFHGQPMAIAMDTLGIATAEIANISERRIERMVNPDLSGLPGFLVSKGGLNCGFMIAQYAAAAVVSENKVLAHPASVDSIPTSANQEDHVSMGTIAARKAREIISHVQSVLGVEYLCAAQAVDFKEPALLGPAGATSYALLRKEVSFMESDRILYPDMNKAKALIASGRLLAAVEKKTGVLE